MFRAMIALGLGLGLCACGDDSDESDSGAAVEHEHVSCGLQENCPNDAPELSSGPTGEGEHFSFMVHNPSDYGPGRGTIIAATMMLHFKDGDGEALADTAVKVYTFSDDCGHEGPTPPEMLTTNAQGMVEFAANFGHGGPWSIVAELTVDDTSDQIELALCIPGEDHTAGKVAPNDEDADHSEHQAAENDENDDHEGAGEDQDGDHRGADEDGDADADHAEE